MPIDCKIEYLSKNGMHADRHTSRGVYAMFWTLTEVFITHNLKKTAPLILLPSSATFLVEVSLGVEFTNIYAKQLSRYYGWWSRK